MYMHLLKNLVSWYLFNPVFFSLMILKVILIFKVFMIIQAILHEMLRNH